MLTLPSPDSPLLLLMAASDLITYMRASGVSAGMGHTDSPWLFSGGRNNTQRGLAGFHYDGMPDAEIARDHAMMASVLKPDTYAWVWCVWPKLWDWLSYDKLLRKAGLDGTTGGAWGKLGNLGVGYHLRGDSEFGLLYKHGNPKARVNNQSNLWMLEDGPTGLWLAQRAEHSVKPLPVLRDLIRLCTDPGDLVLDLYAGEWATMARACRAEGRRYIGCEIDPVRHAHALDVLAQQELLTEQSGFGSVEKFEDYVQLMALTDEEDGHGTHGENTAGQESAH